MVSAYNKLSFIQKVYKTVMTVVFCQIRNYEKFKEKNLKNVGKIMRKKIKNFRCGHFCACVTLYTSAKYM